MRTMIGTVLFLILYTSLWTQEFQTSLYFENSDGLKDSIVVGYDPSASTGIDSQFGEDDILSEPLGVLDIRLSYIIDGRVCGNIPLSVEEVCPFLSKKSIVPKECTMNIDHWGSSVVQCLIRNKDLPVTITWNSDEFLSSCLDESLITEWPSEGWWDFCFPERYWGIFGLNVSQELVVENPVGVQLYNNDNDTFSVLYIGLLHQDIGVDNNEQEAENNGISLFPNPTREKIHFNTKFSHYAIYNIQGKKIISGKNLNNNTGLDVSKLDKGVFIFEGRNEKNEFLQQKFVKD